MSSPAIAIDPKRTALLVMDLQQGIVQRMPALEPLLGRVRQAIADVRDHGGTVGYVRVAFTEEDRAAVPPTNAIFAQASQNPAMHRRGPRHRHPRRAGTAARDFLLGKVFPRRAQIIDTAALRSLLRAA